MNRSYFPFAIVFAGILLSIGLHFNIFDRDLVGYHVWRQSQTQTVIENFCTEDFCILNPRLNNLDYPGGIIRMEFPLYQWMVACVCKVTGHHLFATRVVTFAIGILSVVGFFLLARDLFKSALFGAAGAWALLFSPVFYYYMINPLPDNLALCFGIYALYFFSRYFESRKISDLVFFSALLALSTLCKLPFILYIIPFAVHWFRSSKSLKEFAVVSLFLSLPIVWYGAVMGSWRDNGVVKGVLGGGFDLMTYLDYLQHNFISTLPELYINFSALILFFSGSYYLVKNKIPAKNVLASCFFFGLLGVIAYLLFELNMIAKVHDYYLFPFLPYLFLITLYGFKKLRGLQSSFLKVLAVICITVMPVTAYLRSNSRWNLEEPGFNPTLLHNKEKLREIIPANAICLTGNDDSGMITLYYLNRKGFSFYENRIDSVLIEDYKQKGVSYLVSDAEMSVETLRYLREPLAVFDNIKVYKLK